MPATDDPATRWRCAAQLLGLHKALDEQKAERAQIQATIGRP